VLLGQRDDRDKDNGSKIKKKTAELDWVLRKSMPDESNRVLYLNVRWSNEKDELTERRGAGSLLSN
jgi:hypothetical protein